jgi:hypothetical protein
MNGKGTHMFVKQLLVVLALAVVLGYVLPVT